MNKNIVLIFICSVGIVHASNTNDITPYKFDNPLHAPAYDIPASSRFTVSRAQVDAPAIVYYFSTPRAQQYPIAILCTGSSNRDAIFSNILLHRYFLQEFTDLGAAVLTVEQWGVDGSNIDSDIFIEHYTRSQRLHDHQAVIEYLKSNPPSGWDGTLILFGVSEGGPLVTSLTTEYSDMMRATINWVGAGDWSWNDELWRFIEVMRKNASWWMKLWDFMPRWIPFAFDLPKTRSEYDAIMNNALENPCVEKEFMGMTYKYHADAMTYPATEYHKIRTPFLVVAGCLDSFIDSCDAFVEKAQTAGAPITYIRVEDMDHYVRRRPEIIQQSFDWLAGQMGDDNMSLR